MRLRTVALSIVAALVGSFGFIAAPVSAAPITTVNQVVTISSDGGVGNASTIDTIRWHGKGVAAKRINKRPDPGTLRIRTWTLCALTKRDLQSAGDFVYRAMDGTVEHVPVYERTKGGRCVEYLNWSGKKIAKRDFKRIRVTDVQFTPGKRPILRLSYVSQLGTD